MSYKFKITTKNLNRLKSATKEVQTTAAQRVNKAVTNATADLFSEIQDTTPVGKGYEGYSGGNLKVGNRMDVKGFRGRIWNPVEYARYVHDGTRPYVIRPKNKKALAFKIGDRWVVTKKVNHPGIRAQPWYDEAGRKKVNDLRLEFVKMNKDIANLFK